MKRALAILVLLSLLLPGSALVIFLVIELAKAFLADWPWSFLGCAALLVLPLATALILAGDWAIRTLRATDREHDPLDRES